MRTAFKEWAIVVDALTEGGQIVVLRKGGIDEGKAGFRMEHPRFLFFPTLFHQQRESVVDTAKARYDMISPMFPAPDRLRLSVWADVVDWRQLESLDAAERLRGQHIWRDEVIRNRFDWGRAKNIFALAVRVFRLANPVEIPMSPAYGGCKSWVELDLDVPLEESIPVISESAFATRLREFQNALDLLGASKE